jgi:hypothetical protein
MVVVSAMSVIPHARFGKHRAVNFGFRGFRHIQPNDSRGIRWPLLEDLVDQPANREPRSLCDSRGVGFKDLQANRNISMAANFAAGNSALLPHQQDIAETRAYRPISPIGGILSGIGGVMGGMGGGGGMARAQPRVDPWRGLR